MTRHRMSILKIGVWTTLTALVLASAAMARQPQARQYAVIITNLTAHQVFTPLLVVSHTSDIRLFEPGQPASENLEMLAEAGNIAPFMDALPGSDDVLDIQTNGDVLPPGHSVTIMVRASRMFNRISVAAMRVPTNDGFVALNAAKIPRGFKVRTHRVVGYDAGTEANDQLCDHIPGPPGVCGGEGFNASREGAEGFVHVHRGIHNIGDLAPEIYDSRNPVGMVSIRVIE